MRRRLTGAPARLRCADETKRRREMSVSSDLMGYREMTQRAMRGVVRDALARVAEDGGLPGAHHFLITFRTQARGVDLDPALIEQHPVRMAIVLEHQFWDLVVDDDAFEVTLKFGGVPKYLRVPFAALLEFADPAAKFLLRFDPVEDEATGAPDDADPPSGAGEVVSLDAFRKKPS